MNGLIDLASVGLIGQKAGFSTPIDEQLRSMLDVVSTALKDTAEHFRDERKKAKQCSENDITMAAEEAHELELVRLGVWHDGRLDCIAGNGIMSELGLGIEEPTIYDMPATAAPLMGNNAPIDGEGVPPGGNLDVFDGVTKAVSESARMENLQGDDDVESSLIQTLPIVVLRNFAIKPARGDLWSVMAEWAAGLVENKLAHVIVIGEGSSTIKPLTTALPSKPLNSVALSDADDYNSLEFVHEKLSTTDQPYELTDVDRKNIAKLGGRMVDLELLVYKVRSGQTIPQAVDDIVLRNVVELRKAAFGDDAEDAKHLPWTRAQAWKIVSELAKKPEASYAKLLQDFPFKGSEPSLKALEAHDLVFVQSVDGRPSKIKPGKPVFRQAFASLVDGTFMHSNISDTQTTFSAHSARSSTMPQSQRKSSQRLRRSKPSSQNYGRLHLMGTSSVLVAEDGSDSPRGRQSTNAHNTSSASSTSAWPNSRMSSPTRMSRRRCLLLERCRDGDEVVRSVPLMYLSILACI